MRTKVWVGVNTRRAPPEYGWSTFKPSVQTHKKLLPRYRRFDVHAATRIRQRVPGAGKLHPRDLRLFPTNAETPHNLIQTSSVNIFIIRTAGAIQVKVLQFVNCTAVRKGFAVGTASGNCLIGSII
jgi:hypothetical protein